MIGVISIAALAYGFFYFENNCIDTSKIKINCNIKNSIRMVQISDLHSKEFGKNNKRLYKSILSNNPDFVVATGDIINSNMKNIDKIVRFLGDLNKYTAVFYIPGNNEMRCEALEEIIYKLKKEKIYVLENEIISIDIHNEKINILGLVEERIDRGEFINHKAKSKYIYKDAHKLFKELDNKNGLKIVLSHYPENFNAIGKESYSKYKFDLMLSGHAHGGQFILPFIGGLFAPGQGVLPKYYNGLYEDKNKLIVSRGLGNSGFPIRLFNRPNLVVVDIMKY